MTRKSPSIRRRIAPSYFALAYIALGAPGFFAGSVHAARPLEPGGHVGPMLPPFAGAPAGVSGTWTKVGAAFPGGSPDTALLMTDGDVLMHAACSSAWYRLTPDPSGSYASGTWRAAAPMPAGYAPLYFASSVLPDGRLLVNGGEYNGSSCAPVWTTLGALYDPVADSWSPVAPPTGWTQVGDAASVILSTGHYMLQSVSGSLQAIATVAPLPAATVSWAKTGAGKADGNDEEGWTTLADTDLLTLDTNRSLGANTPAELYSPATGAWTAAATAPTILVDPGSHEIGPAVRRPDGSVFQSGASPCRTSTCPGHTAIYGAAGTWTVGPDFPAISGANYDVTDGPAAILPDGNVLVQTSPAYACLYKGKPSPYCSPSHFFEFDGTTLTRVNEPATAPKLAAYQGRMLVLPTGQILWSGASANDIEVYTPAGTAKKAWKPLVVAVNPTLSRGQSNYLLGGKRLHGVSNGAAYGDDAQMATAYPIIRITNLASGHVCFARTHDHAVDHTLFDMPGATPPAWEQACDIGASKLQVIVNGIASASTPVMVQ